MGRLGRWATAAWLVAGWLTSARGAQAQPAPESEAPPETPPAATAPAVAQPDGPVPPPPAPPGPEPTPTEPASPTEPVRPVPPPPPPPPEQKRWASRAGPSVAIGLGFAYGHLIADYETTADVRRRGSTEVLYPAGTSVTGTGGLFGAGVYGQFDYGFTDYVFLGFHLGFGGAFTSAAPAPIIDAGPGMTFFLGEVIYLGVDGILSYVQFQEVSASASLTGSSGHEATGSFVSLGPSLRLGFAVPMTTRFAITPELRVLGRLAIVNPDGELTFDNPEAELARLSADVLQQYTLGGGINLGFRWFL